MAKLTKYEAQRCLITEHLGYLEPYGFHHLNALMEKYGGDAYLDIEQDYDDVTIKVMRNRPETDEEYETRTGAILAKKVAQATKKRQAKIVTEEAERAEYQRLKQKYG